MTANSAAGAPPDRPGHGPARPSPWVTRFAPLVAEGGAVLDLACGRGRHLRMFRSRGHPVVGVDVDVSGVADLIAAPGVEIIEADLETGEPWPLAGRTFQGIVVVNYLHRPLLPDLIGALGPGGVLIYETFALGNERYGKPRNPDHLLRPGELLDAVAGRLEVVAYEHGIMVRERSAVVGRICAVRPTADGATWLRPLNAG